MTRKDYVLIAGVLRDLPKANAYDRSICRQVAWRFAEKLREANANFDEEKFLVAALGKELAKSCAP